jgi:hypothetical protein
MCSVLQSSNHLGSKTVGCLHIQPAPLAGPPSLSQLELGPSQSAMGAGIITTSGLGSPAAHHPKIPSAQSWPAAATTQGSNPADQSESPGSNPQGIAPDIASHEGTAIHHSETPGCAFHHISKRSGSHGSWCRGGSVMVQVQALGPGTYITITRRTEKRCVTEPESFTSWQRTTPFILCTQGR